MKRVLDGLEIIGLGLWIKKLKLLVLADFHLGYEEYLIGKGVILPKDNLKWIIKQLKDIFKKVGKVNTTIINGDLKHEFSAISKQEWKECFALLGFLKENCQHIILVKGNHDTIVKPILNKFAVKITDCLKIGDMLVVHGHNLKHLSLKGIKILITAHEHPAFEICDGLKKEKYKAYYIGSYKGKTLIMQPSFNMLSIGSKPRLKFNVKKIYALGNKVYEFRR